jgi:phenylalanyl-tRNA synthetase beta chain
MAQEGLADLGGIMPTIDVSHRDLCRLIGRNIPVSKLRDEGILYAKGEIDEASGDKLKIDIKDTNRPDLWSAEGIAREIRGRYVSGGVPRYATKKSSVIVNVDRKMKNTRPFTVCAVVRNLRVDEDSLSQLIQLQEKVSTTFGRNRREVAIGVYDMNRIKSPIKFTTVKPDGITFVPLEFRKPMTPGEILKNHPKGREFSHLLKGMTEYPIFIDAAGEVLSIPPIINSEYTGKVTVDTRDVFIECSGFDLKFLLPSLNVMVAAMADRGGIIETVRVKYPDKTIETPDMEPKGFEVDLDYLNRVSGLGLSIDKACKLLNQARYDAKPVGKKIKVLYPSYRQDMMHQRDVIEDVIISYGFNNIDPVMPRLATIGRQSKKEIFSNKVSDLMTGLGLQEILSYILTSKNNLFEKMNTPEEKTVEIENIVSANWCVFRSWLLPNILEFLSKNKHVEYPQRVFEIGDVVNLDGKEETQTKDEGKLAVAITDNVAGYEDISSTLDSLLRNLGIEYDLRSTNHPSFIKGRTADIFSGGKRIGIVGEINPIVLERWELEKPVVGFEVDLEKLLP